MSRSPLAVARAVIRRANAWFHGFSGSLPLGSRVSRRRDGLTISDGFYASGPVWIECVDHYAGQNFSPEVLIDSSVRTSPRLHISAVASIHIGSGTLFGENVFVSDHQHGATSGEGQPSPSMPPALRPLGGAARVLIGMNCHFGNNVVVTPGVTIGDGSIIGANSVVTRDIPPGVIAVGAPAVPIKRWDDVKREWVSVSFG